MLESLTPIFVRKFGREPRFAGRAPGRINLIGEHTDYSEGWVLPCAIDRDTWVLGAARDDRHFRVEALDLATADAFDATRLERRGTWIDYFQGIVGTLASRGSWVRGADLLVTSQVPREVGLSSSAALGVAITAALDGSEGLGLGAREWARVAHRSENAFVGVGSGIMDPFASALGREGWALLLDCRTETAEEIPLAADAVALVVIDSGVRRALASGATGYGDRVAECAAAFDQARDAGLVRDRARSLRDLGVEDLPHLEDALDPTLFRRARHVISENERVLTVAELLAGAARGEPGALEGVGERLADGQRSLRDDFEVSTPELDALCAIVSAQPGVYGSRLTGAGMGGCTLHLVAPAAVDRLEGVVARDFEARFGRRPAMWRLRAAAGAESIRLAR